MPAKSLELQHTIRLIRELDAEISEIEAAIKQIIDQIASPILTIPGISYRMGAMILAEIGDFSRFDSPDKILAYAGLSPSTYQSGKLDNAYAHMEKRGSRYLRYALYNAAKYVCHWDASFSAYGKTFEAKYPNSDMCCKLLADMAPASPCVQELNVLRDIEFHLRNVAAHTIEPITEERIRKECRQNLRGSLLSNVEWSSSEIFKLLKQCAQSILSSSELRWNSYDLMNERILRAMRLDDQ